MREKSGASMTFAVPLWLKFVSVITFVLPICSIFLYGWTPFLESLDISRYPFRWIAVLAFFLAGPYWLLRVLFSRTIFGDTGIVHRNFLLKTINEAYENIADLKVTSKKELLIEFRNGKKIKVGVGDAKLPLAVKFLKEKTASATLIQQEGMGPKDGQVVDDN